MNMRRIDNNKSLFIAVVIAPAFAFFAAASTVVAQGAKPNSPARAAFTSVYTDMQRDCKFVRDPEAEAQGSDSPKVCKGFGGYQLTIGYSAWGAAVAVERAGKQGEHFPLGEDYGDYGARGEKVEWRLASGKPFAVIIRLGKYGEPSGDGNPFANRTGSKLIVKGLKGWEQIDFEVDGAATGANEKARRMADENYSKR
jgi:hypothetical protein